MSCLPAVSSFKIRKYTIKNKSIKYCSTQFIMVLICCCFFMSDIDTHRSRGTITYSYCWFRIANVPLAGGSSQRLQDQFTWRNLNGCVKLPLDINCHVTPFQGWYWYSGLLSCKYYVYIKMELMVSSFHPLLITHVKPFLLVNEDWVIDHHHGEIFWLCTN